MALDCAALPTDYMTTLLQVANETLGEMSQQGEQMRTANSKVKDINHNLTQNFGKKKLFKKFRKTQTEQPDASATEASNLKNTNGYTSGDIPL